MHWIGIGILIWIGLAIAPAVLTLAFAAMPFVIGAIIGALIGGAITHDGGGIFLCAIIGGVLPYVVFNTMSDRMLRNRISKLHAHSCF